MNKEIIKQEIAKKLSEKRYAHTIRVTEVAAALANHYKIDVEQVELAALYHDYYKDTSDVELIASIQQYNLPSALLTYDKELWHGPVAAAVVKDKHEDINEDVYHAIYYHTTGRPHMSMIEKIVFIADYIEPNRQIPGIEAVRIAAYEAIDDAVFLALNNTVAFLRSLNKAIYPTTLKALKYYEGKGSGNMVEKNKALLQIVVDACEDRKADHILAYDMEKVSSIADYFVICSGSNERQVQAIARSVKEAADKKNYTIERMEGFDQARWIVLDIGDLVCHVFHEEERVYYQLEKLWGDATEIDMNSWNEK